MRASILLALCAVALAACAATPMDPNDVCVINRISMDCQVQQYSRVGA
jgi:hypothetical protein